MTDETPAPGAPRSDPLSRVWRSLAAPQVLIALLGLVALSLLLASLIPQIPPQAVGDSQAWLAVQSGLLGRQNELVRVLGLFDVFHALWFHLLLALIGLCLLVRLVEAAEFAWLASVSKRWQMSSFAFWGRNAPRIHLFPQVSADGVDSRVRSFFAEGKFRWVDVPDSKTTHAVIARREFALWGQPMAYGALLVGLVGLFIVGTWGWQTSKWYPAPGDAQAVGHGTSYTLRLDSFDLQVDQERQLLDYSSDIAWLQDGVVVKQSAVEVGQPAILHDVAVRQTGYLPALKVRVWDEEAQPLTLQTAGDERALSSEVEILFPSSEAQPLVLIPAQDLFLAFNFVPLCPDGRPLVQISLLRNGGTERQFLGSLYEGGELAEEGLQIQVDLTYRPELRADFLPAMGIVVAGMAIAILTLAVGWIVPPRLAWITFVRDEEGAKLHVLVPAGARSRRWLLRLGEQLREALEDDA